MRSLLRGLTASPARALFLHKKVFVHVAHIVAVPRGKGAGVDTLRAPWVVYLLYAYTDAQIYVCSMAMATVIPIVIAGESFIVDRRIISREGEWHGTVYVLVAS